MSVSSESRLRGVSLLAPRQARRARIGAPSRQCSLRDRRHARWPGPSSTSANPWRCAGWVRTEVAKVQVEAISSALELYALDNGTYPPAQLGLDALTVQPQGATRWSGPYLKKPDGLIDPLGAPLSVPRSGTRGRLRGVHTRPRQCAGRNRRDSDVTNCELDALPAKLAKQSIMSGLKTGLVLPSLRSPSEPLTRARSMP